MNEINVVLDIDDMNPSKDWGIKKDNSEYYYINKLQEEFPNLKITFFIPANFESKADLRLNPDWIDWLKNKPNIEIAAHGVTHYNQHNKKDSREFYNVTPWEIAFKLQESKKIFKEVGIDVKGIKAGGWDILPEFYELVPYYFDYMADHFIGDTPQKVTDNFYKVNYTYSIDNIGPKYYDTIILHGHFCQQKGNKNGLDGPIYQCIRNYLNDLESKFKVNYLTMYELVKKTKEKQNGK